MTHISDLAPISYLGLKGPIRAVGWLESSHPFSCGSVDADFSRRLVALVERPLFGTMMLGLHYCSLCAAEDRSGPDSRSSQSELLVPAWDCVYEAPIWIGHYVLAHRYQPPEEFIRAVMTCPEPGSQEYRTAIQAHVQNFTELEWFRVVRLGARWTFKPSPKHGNKAAHDARIERQKLEYKPLPTREQVIEKHGGHSEAKCAWANCNNRALAEMVVCFEHAYPNYPG
jgi:hypothetical protein